MCIMIYSRIILCLYLTQQPGDLDKPALHIVQFTFRNAADMMPNPDQNLDWHASRIQLHGGTEPN